MPNITAAQLRQAFLGQSLPGLTAQLRMAHAMRGQLPQQPASVRKAAVLALCYPSMEHDGDLRLIFIRRSSREVRDRHAGQIGFPGGSVEPEDKTLAATALRETEEEIGVPKEAVELLGPLTELYIPVSNFLVRPFVGLLAARPTYRLQPSEVDAVLEIPLREFFEPDVQRTKSIALSSGMRLQDVPYWHLGEHHVWGATAMMTSELVVLVQSARNEHGS